MRQEMIKEVYKRYASENLTEDSIIAAKEYWIEVLFKGIFECYHHGSFNVVDLEALKRIKLFGIEPGDMIEIKAFHSWHREAETENQTPSMHVSGLKTKKGNAKWVLVYDGIHHRASLIPASVMYRKGVCYVDPKGEYHFRFTTKKSNMASATKVFAKYMLTGKKHLFGLNETKYIEC